MDNTQMTVSLSVDSIVDTVLALSALTRAHRGDGSTSAPQLLCRREAPALARLAARAFGAVALELIPYVVKTDVDNPARPAMLTMELGGGADLPPGASGRIADLLEGAVTAELFRSLWAGTDVRRAASYAAMVRESLDLLRLRLRGAAVAAHPGLRTTPWGAWSL